MLIRWVSVWSLLLSAAFALEIHDVSQDWRAAVIEKELAPFKGRGITFHEIEHKARPGHICAFKIENGVLKWASSIELPGPLGNALRLRKHEVTKAINKLLAAKPLPNMTLLVDMLDSSLRGSEEDIPVFVFSKHKSQKFSILMPDFEMLSYGQGLYGQVLAASHAHSWHVKQPVAFWRGSTTGGSFNVPNWRWFPRAQLVLKTMPTRGLVNARFTNYCQGAEVNQDFLAVMKAPAPHISIPDHLQFKYLIDIDGNASTYSRYFWILLSNSMPLKVTSEFTQWYYDGLAPYVHYLPVAPDVSDIVDKIYWAMANDDKAYAIAMRSQQFAMQYLHEDSIYSYLYHLLLAYSELFER